MAQRTGLKSDLEKFGSGIIPPSLERRGSPMFYAELGQYCRHFHFHGFV
jgi:hypothetical protein